MNQSTSSTNSLVKAWYEYIPLARDLALEVVKPVPGLPRVVALRFENGRTTRFGVNQLRGSEVSMFSGSLHAEYDLLRKEGSLKGAKLLMYRFNTALGSPLRNQPLNARPCLLCGHMLREQGVRKVVFVNDNGEVCCAKSTEFPLLAVDPVSLTRHFYHYNAKESLKVSAYLL